MPSPYLDRLLRAAMKRRGLDTLALKALMKATHLLGLALAGRLREYRDGRDPTIGRFAEIQEQVLHASLLREALDVLGSRWDKLRERERPHYSPQDRFRILRLRALLALSAVETARTFRVSTGTVHRWESEAQATPDRQTVGSLLKPDPPVRRFADVVRHVVSTLTVAGFPGDATVAASLARAGWRLSRRTVQRIRRERPMAVPPAPPSAAAQDRSVRARYPHHVWMFDITEIPGFLRLFSFKLAVVFDVFSRSPLSARIFLSEPAATEIGQLLLATIRRFGAPRHSVSDRGPQFTAQRFQSSLTRHGIRHRFGAIGRTGSIALIERFFRTLKALGAFRTRPPFLRADLQARLTPAFSYYLWLRPHRGLAGSTPAECLLGLTPAHLDAIPPPRGRPGEAVSTSPPFELRYLGADRTLPYLLRKAA
jgi:transposase InsO family protein